METYRFIVQQEVTVKAPSEGDAIELLQDIYGDGDHEDFDVRVMNVQVIPQ